MRLNFPNPTAITDGKKVDAKKVKQAIYKPRQHEIQSTVSEERWQGKLINNRWDDEKVKLEEYFLRGFFHGRMPQSIPSLEYKSFCQQLLPTKVYYNRKTKSQVTDEKCRLCGDSVENVHFTMTFSNCLQSSVPIIPASIQGLPERS